MAVKNLKVQEEIPERTTSVGVKQRESLYSVKELANNANKLFGTRSECVIAAFKSAGKTEATKPEAKKIVEGFLKKEVK